MKQYEKQTDKDYPESLNRAMGGVLYGRGSVFQKTPKTTKAKILRSLSKRGDMFERIAAKELKKLGKRATPEAVAAQMKKIYNRRVQAIAYIKAGWAIAAREFGASRIRKPRSGVATKGEAKKAQLRDLEAFALNAVGADLEQGAIRQKTYAAVQTAVNAKTEDMLKYLQRRMEKANKTHGGRN